MAANHFRRRDQTLKSAKGAFLDFLQAYQALPKMVEDLQPHRPWRQDEIDQ